MSMTRKIRKCILFFYHIAFYKVRKSIFVAFCREAFYNSSKILFLREYSGKQAIYLLSLYFVLKTLSSAQNVIKSQWSDDKCQKPRIFLPDKGLQ